MFFCDENEMLPSALFHDDDVGHGDDDAMGEDPAGQLAFAITQLCSRIHSLPQWKYDPATPLNLLGLFLRMGSDHINSEMAKSTILAILVAIRTHVRNLTRQQCAGIQDMLPAIAPLSTAELPHASSAVWPMTLVPVMVFDSDHMPIRAWADLDKLQPSENTAQVLLIASDAHKIGFPAATHCDGIHVAVRLPKTDVFLYHTSDSECAPPLFSSSDAHMHSV